MIKGIEHLAICSNDTTRLKDWYVKTFDFKVVYDNGKGTFFVAAPDNSMIEIIKADSECACASDKAQGLRHIALEVDDFEGMVEKLKKAGVEVVADAAVSSSNVKTFFFKDIDGNLLHLISRPKPLI